MVSGWYSYGWFDAIGHSWTEVFYNGKWNHHDPTWHDYLNPGTYVKSGFQWDPVKTKKSSPNCNAADEDRHQVYN